MASTELPQLSENYSLGMYKKNIYVFAYVVTCLDLINEVSDRQTPPRGHAYAIFVTVGTC